MAETRAKKVRSRQITTLIVGLFACLFVLPLVWMILTSFKSTNEVFGTTNWLPSKWHWSNYAEVWTNPQLSMAKCYWNSILIVVIGTAGQLIVSSMAAYAFAKIDFKGKKFVFTLFLASIMIPSQVTIIPRFMLFYKMGIYNTLWSIILPSWFGATSIFLLRQFYMGLPNDLIEAAKIDGANDWTVYWRIVLPLFKAGLATIGLFNVMVSCIVLSFIALWNEYLSPLIFLTNKKVYTIAQAIRWYLMSDTQQYELTMAAASIAIVPLIILFVFCQKYFVEGIATSGMKG